jgi:hypothetical protein
MQCPRSKLSSLGITEKCAEHSSSAHLAVSWYVGSSNWREYDAFLASAGCKHVQSAITAFTGHGAKIEKGSGLIWCDAISNGDENYVTLIALDCFKIFNEYP